MNTLRLLTKLKPCSSIECTCIPKLQKYTLRIPISEVEEEIYEREIEHLKFEYKHCYENKIFRNWQKEFFRTTHNSNEK